jgi:catechol 2,3-dioxygenase
MHIAEVGLRVAELARAVAFYQDILGLEIVRAYPHHVFMHAGELDSPLGRAGHPQLLVLFDREVPLDIHLTTVDHLAFEIPIERYTEEKERLRQKGFELRERIWSGDHAWLRARSIFFSDSEGHTLEFIAHDPNHNTIVPLPTK